MIIVPITKRDQGDTFLQMLQDLELSNCKNIVDFSSLSHLKKLELQNETLLTDISPLQNIAHLRFLGCPNNRNFSLLNSQNQESVFLRQCPISDISFLRNMKMVNAIISSMFHLCMALRDYFKIVSQPLIIVPQLTGDLNVVELYVMRRQKCLI